VHHPVINQVAAHVRDTLARHHVSTYSDTAHVGVARYLQVVVERETQRAQVTLITNGTAHDALQPFFVDLQATLGPQLHSLWWNGNPERSNAFLGPHWDHMHGPRHVTDRSGDARVFYPPHAFGQSNLDLAMQLAARVRELAHPATRITEYYAGVGAIGLGLASTAAALRLNELGEGSLEGLAYGVDALPEAQRANVALYPGSAAAHAPLIAETDFVIADPPRKGLDAELLGALRQAPPARFAYVSCDIDSFERDAAQLLGSFRLVSLEAFDLFPHTEHVETLAVFEPR
jgi:23S rRNA (uracil1939-C5)-methyltransferase